MEWIIPANSKVYDHASSLEHFDFIDWHQGIYKYSIGDIVFLYCTLPYKKIKYKCTVEKVDLPFEAIRDDKDYWIDKDKYTKSKIGKFMRLRLLDQVDSEKLSLEQLLLNGLKAAPQGAVKVVDELRNYLHMNFSEEVFFADEVNSDLCYEGIKKTVVTNKYERSSLARKLCIEENGCKCKVCGFDFESIYGELGKDYIHIHHIIPIHNIGKEYKIDYKNDLIPVCANCHSMIHRKKNITLPINDLKSILRSHSI
jgi:5-methylcytosine-specific restriction enzyme A